MKIGVLLVAGQRVQIIKNTPAGKGTLQFGTEVISAADGSIAALLGASPGASTAVSVMLELINRCFPQHIKAWEPKIKEMIPSYGMSLSGEPGAYSRNSYLNSTDSWIRRQPGATDSLLK